jgi:hypothetical protein
MQKYERKDTIVCTFDKRSPRTAYDVHEWIYQEIHLDTDDVATIQIDGPQR